jgi:hypothetical protein
MRTIILFPFLAGVGYLGGCATTMDEKPPMTAVPDQAPASVVGLAVYQPRSDVANLTESVRHVLNPADIYGTDTRKVDTESPFRTVQYRLPAAKPKKVSAPLMVAGLERKKDPVYEAWRKFCDESKHMTDEDWALINRTTMPPELEAIWAAECVPLK